MSELLDGYMQASDEAKIRIDALNEELEAMQKKLDAAEQGAKRFKETLSLIDISAGRWHVQLCSAPSSSAENIHDDFIAAIDKSITNQEE